MAQHERSKETLHGLEEESHKRKKTPQPIFDQLKAAGEGVVPNLEFMAEALLGDHAAMLADIHSNEQQVNLITQLQQSYGNAYVQRVIERIQAEKGSGKPLEPEVRSEMERSFGKDFSDVRIHADSTADELAKELGAKAFTTGKDIFFRKRAYQPDSNSSKALIAHELTHAARQDVASVTRESAKADEEEEEGEEEERVATQTSPNPQGRALEQGQFRQLPEPPPRQIEWGSNAKPQDIESLGTPWGAASPESGREISWAASETGETIGQPQRIFWGASQNLGEAKDADKIPSAIESPELTTLTNLETTYGQGYRAVAPWPTNEKAPSFEFNIEDRRGPVERLFGCPEEWVAKPTLKQKAYEGHSQPLYLGPGLHKTTKTHAKTGLPIFEEISMAVSALLCVAELEHAKDYKYAYKISLQEAEEVLTKHIVGKEFGPKPTKGAVEQMVLDTIKGKLTHPDLGTDQTKWADKYTALQLKTLDRDNKKWHTFTGTKLRRIKGDKGKTIGWKRRLVESGTTKIGVVSSKDIIKY